MVFIANYDATRFETLRGESSIEAIFVYETRSRESQLFILINR